MPSAVPLLPTLLVLMPACVARRWFCASVRNPAEAPLPKDGGDTPVETPAVSAAPDTERAGTVVVGRALRGGRKMGEGWPLLLLAVLPSVDDEAEAEDSPPPSRASESTALISSSDCRTCAHRPQNALKSPTTGGARSGSGGW